MPDIRILLAVALVAILGFVLAQPTSMLSPEPMRHSSEEPAHEHQDEHHDEAESSATARSADDASVHVVRMVTTDGGEYHFEPHIVWLQPGDAVRWELQSGAHTATAYHPDNGNRPLRIPEGAEPWNSEFLVEDGPTTYERTFTVEGVYDYFCIPHEGYGMVGTLVVGEPGNGPGLSQPATKLPQAAQDRLRELNGAVRDGSGSDVHHDDQ